MVPIREVGHLKSYQRKINLLIGRTDKKGLVRVPILFLFILTITPCFAILILILKSSEMSGLRSRIQWHTSC